jgi:hypothetical protein
MWMIVLSCGRAILRMLWRSSQGRAQRCVGSPAGLYRAGNRQMSHVNDRSGPRQCYPTHARIVVRLSMRAAPSGVPAPAGHSSLGMPRYATFGLLAHHQRTPESYEQRLYPSACPFLFQNYTLEKSPRHIVYATTLAAAEVATLLVAAKLIPAHHFRVEPMFDQGETIRFTPRIPLPAALLKLIAAVPEAQIVHLA